MVRCVLIDDDPAVSKDFEQYAAASGDVTLVPYASADAAERAIVLMPPWEMPQLILVDYDLGRGATGMEFVRAIRHRVFSAAIVLLTHHDDPEIAFEAGAAGATLFCRKNALYSTETFQELVKRAIAEGAERREEVRRSAEVIAEGVAHLLDECIHETRNIFVPIKKSAEAIADSISRCELGRSGNDETEFEVAQIKTELRFIHERAEEGRKNFEVLDDFTEAFTVKLDPQLLDLDSLIRECAKAHLDSSRPRQVDIGIKTEIRLTRDVLWRIMRALLRNVEDHVVAGTPVHVTGDMALAGPVRMVQICVRDFGQGIPAELRTKIFEPGIVGHEPRQSTHKGLGLSIVRRLCEVHDVDGVRGSVYCGEVTGAGALFVVEIPVE